MKKWQKDLREVLDKKAVDGYDNIYAILRDNEAKKWKTRQSRKGLKNSRTT